MTPDKRRPATPASEGPTKAAPARKVPPVAVPPSAPPPPTPGGVRAPDVPTAPPDPPVPDELVTAVALPAETKDSTQKAPPGEASGDSAPPTETGQADPVERATTPRRPLALYPLPVWPD